MNDPKTNVVFQGRAKAVENGSIRRDQDDRQYDRRNTRRLLRLRERVTHLDSRIVQREGAGLIASFEKAERSALCEAIARWEIFNQRFESEIEAIKARLSVVTAEERLEALDKIFDGWCFDCGGPEPCRCWDDK